jgi:CRP-like cAMP-binding protein
MTFMASQTDLDLLAELRLLPMFADVSREAIVELAGAAAQRRVHAGVPLVEQGVASPGMVILLRGAAKVWRVADGGGGSAQVVLDVMRSPCIIADVSVLDGSPAASTVVTLRSSQVVTIDRRVVAKVAMQHPSFARALLLRMAQEVRQHTRRIDEIIGGPVDERIKHVLESLAEQHGTPLGQGRFIAIPLRRKDLACMVNATTETVSRLLAKFEREGQARSTRDGIWWRSAQKPAAPASAPQTTPPPAAEASPLSSKRIG